MKTEGGTERFVNPPLDIQSYLPKLSVPLKIFFFLPLKMYLQLWETWMVKA